LKRRTADDPNELLRTGYLCRGGGLLLAAPTGIGKSSFALQAMILWALGRACFGITPTRPLKSLLIQAENDDGDLAEMRDGVIAGMDLTDDEKKTAMENVIVFQENTRGFPLGYGIGAALQITSLVRLPGSILHVSRPQAKV